MSSIEQIDSKSLENLYDNVKKKLDDIANNIQTVKAEQVGAKSDDKASIEQKDRANALAQAKEIFQECEQTTRKGIEDLENVSEFKTYTIAFYGETNAGKSTIIEALRLYFNEKTKQKDRKEFDENYTALRELKESIKAQESNISTLKQELQEIELGGGKQNIIIKFFKSIYKILPFTRYKKLQKSIKKHSEKLEILQLQYKESIKNLLALSDGVIIGDGRSDFTQKSHIYHFNANDKTFDIIDVPGIEGKEEKVKDEILKAVKKAHCVFYVVKNPQPPQKGDDETQGTIAKIKEHLGSQTEVYSIYNKPINNPNQLTNDSIATNDEEDGLDELDSKMAEMLNTKDYEHYRGNEILSAQIAFYALGDKMLDVGFINDIDSADDKRKVTTLTNGRKKFLEKYTKDDLLSKSLFYEFASLIENTLLKNAEEKIKKSYYNKVHYILSGMIEMLEKLCEIYNDLYSKCKKEVDLSCDNIDRILQGTKQNFKSECDSVIDKFKSKVRNQMYNDINKDISNGDFKDKFEKTIEKEQEILKANFQEASNNVQEKFKKDLSDELENLQRRIGNVAEEFKEITLSNKFDSSLNIKIDNGINTMGLLSTGIGGAGLAMWIAGATNIWNPAGIAIIALSVLGLIISFGKAIRGFFDKEYKKREQRKSVDENLQKISQDMKKEVKKSIDEQARDNLEPYIKSVKDKLEKSVESIKNLSEFLEDSQNEVQNLANTIKIEGGL